MTVHLTRARHRISPRSCDACFRTGSLTGGGLLLVAGYRTRFIAAVLAIFALATAVSFHNNFADQNQVIHFLKNVMMAGGLLQIVAFGAGALSLDNLRNAGGLRSSPAAVA
jgi:putative oxidoreductase